MVWLTADGADGALLVVDLAARLAALALVGHLLLAHFALTLKKNKNWHVVLRFAIKITSGDKRLTQRLLCFFHGASGEEEKVCKAPLHSLFGKASLQCDKWKHS